MMRFIYILLLSIFFAIGGYAQVMQTTGGAGGNKFKALKADSFLVVPKGTDTANLANPKWGESTTGALFVKTADSTLWFKVGGQWVQAGGNFTQTVIGNDTTIYEFVIDSTGAAANRVLFAGAKKIRSDSHFLWDSVNNKLVINHFNHSIGGVNTKLYVVGNTNLNGNTNTQQMRVSAITQVFNDTTNYKPVIVNSSGDLYKLDRWPSGTGGSGTVTSFSAGTLSPLFTTSVATATTTPALSFSLSNAGAYTVFGNQTNASAAPSFAKLNINTIDATGTPSATTYLRGDGSWQTISSSGVPSDSLVFQKKGWSQRINTVAWNSWYNGSVGASAAAAAVDSANFLWGVRAGSALTTGYRNIAMGRAAMKAATTGSFNIAIGDSAMATGVTTGLGYHVAIGYRALQSVTSQQYNVAIGYEALRSASSSFGYNTVVGGLSGIAISTGAGNAAFGTRALQASSTASEQTAVGDQSLYSATGGSNTAIGYASGYNITSGTHNLAIGRQSMGQALSSVTGVGNTVIGNNAGIRMTSADYNTIITNLGSTVSVSNLSTGDYNIIIGATDENNLTTGSRNMIFAAQSPGLRILTSGATDQIHFITNSINRLSNFGSDNWLVNVSGAAVTSATASTALEINGTTGAVLFPRLTTTQRDALTATDGMVIYNTSTSKLQVRAGGAWVDLH